MLLIEKITANRKAQSLKKITVEEWEADIYYKQLTGEELDAAELDVPDGASVTRRNAQLVVLKALDASGKRVFRNADADALVASEHPSVINRVAAEMAAVTSREDAKKKSPQTTT